MTLSSPGPHPVASSVPLIANERSSQATSTLACIQLSRKQTETTNDPGMMGTYLGDIIRLG